MTVPQLKFKGKEGAGQMELTAIIWDGCDDTDSFSIFSTLYPRNKEIYIISITNIVAETTENM